MISKYSIILLAVHCYIQFSYCQPSVKFFRNDYEYNENTRAFYKISTKHRTWDGAKEICELEGAELFYPMNEDEAEEFIAFWNRTQPFSWIFIGISTPNVKEVFETVDGLSVSNVYENWGPGEPNNAGGKEECVVMRRDGTYNDDMCSKKFPFACKKSLDTLQWNTHCDIPDLAYQWNETFGRCYKFHLNPKNWTDAYAACRTEDGYLAVINSAEEAKYLVDMTTKAPKENVKGDYLRGIVHLGFHCKGDTWKTISRNKPLEQSGYTEWGNQQPDGKGLETCGSMFYNGRLNDISCDRKAFFICEHEPRILRLAYDLRFGTVFTTPGYNATA